MPNLLNEFYGVLGLLSLALLLLKVFALVDAALRRGSRFEAAGKLKKPFWLIILGIAVTYHLLTGDSSPTSALLSFINVAGVVAAIVYLVDVRPAVRAPGKGGKRDGDDRHMGPYGPW